jgi:acetate---CoA ligase (ADP-forming)
MPHRLDPLLKPASIAVLGATEREGTVGRLSIENLLAGGFAGPLYAVNPRYSSVCGVPCYPSLAALPSPVEHVVFAVSDERIEAALEDAIAQGAGAATIMSTLVLENDRTPLLRERIAARIAATGLLVCGANGMGFYNFADGVRACGFATRRHRRGGNVAYISHSGSAMCGIVDTDERLDFNLVVSTGQELAVSMDEYLDFALELPGTRVVGLFMETARNPDGLVRALAKAQARRIPVVALKVGRTELAARLAVSHSGAIAGNDASYQALFDRYGVQRVADLDQLATALIMFAQPHAVARGGLVSIHDSGGERQLLIDQAAAARVPLAQLSSASVAKLEQILDPGLPAVNPLDAWSTGGPDFHVSMQQCFATLMCDEDAAFGAVVHDRAPGGGIFAAYIDYLRAGHAASGKPAFLVSNRQGTGADPLVIETTRAGLPVLDGVASFLRGAGALLAWRDFHARAPMAAPHVPAAAIERLRLRLASGAVLDEAEAGELLRDVGIPVNRSRIVSDARAARHTAREFGYPVALKTAQPGIHHKSDADAVILGIADDAGVDAAYAALATRCGPRVLVAPMVAAAGVELMLGLVRDEQFGPIVVMGFGGVHVEALADAVFAMPPFDASAAERLLARLERAPLLRSRRFRRPLALDAYCEAAARFSVVADALRDVIEELDLNPVIVHADGCTAVDALVVGRRLQGGPASLERKAV